MNGKIRIMATKKEQDLNRPLDTLLKDESAATTLEWTLLLAAIALPSWFILELALDLLVGHYQMQTALNGIPFP